MEVSVALCTYNGEKYLSELLDSLVSQSRPPNEIVICDDCSSDSTLQILKEFKSECELDVRLVSNSNRLGVNKNFIKCVNLCMGDAIAICDQDDIWDENKIEREVNMMQKDSSTQVVFHNSTIADENLEPMGNLWEAVGYSHGELKDSRSTFQRLLIENVVQGSTMLIDSTLIEDLPLIPEEWNYDHFIALYASLVTNICDIDEELLIYRQHENQKIGAPSAESRCIIPIMSFFDSLRGEPEDYRRQANMMKTITTLIESVEEDRLNISRKKALSSVHSVKSFRERQAKIFDGSEHIKDRMYLVYKNYNEDMYRKYSQSNAVVVRDIIRSVYHKH
ncbi:MULTISPECIES: glycosyltransferase family 2 protein [Halomicrobium]|uniref:Glycosyl transferase family 2 n=2 Tax=Halomicrobium mukohataei TaxID=57705 RepID=C7NVV2_HALMD|nr:MULTISPECIES: glycosyltransferase family 2 protein [Halomicrobium]ACV46217.1 glycosyl transferase family 2 [Halomicrobium mukohataei DSM 12286]QCD64780.1 glycosyltransferase family 2 protein [Halomicrobium mukohataei]QFR19587.1 glycosyltransferase [Halomicrobium sp. ZPS1]